MTNPEHCDFCYLPSPQWRIPSQDFETVVTTSKGDWYACAVCAKLIEAGQWSGLLSRAEQFWNRSHPVPMSPMLREVLRQTYSSLRANMTGPVQER